MEREFAYSLSEVARMLKVSKPTLHRLLKTGGLPSVKLKRRRLILAEDLGRFLESRKGGSHAEQ